MKLLFLHFVPRPFTLGQLSSMYKAFYEKEKNVELCSRPLLHFGKLLWQMGLRVQVLFLVLVPACMFLLGPLLCCLLQYQIFLSLLSRRHPILTQQGPQERERERERETGKSGGEIGIFPTEVN